MTATQNTPILLGKDLLTPAQLRYWQAKTAKLAGRVDYVDPFRRNLSNLCDIVPPGKKVYRASTGGKWGRSAEIKTLR